MDFGRYWNRCCPTACLSGLGVLASATASLYAVNPLARQGVATLFATHPPIAERVRRLRALDDDQALGLAV